MQVAKWMTRDPVTVAESTPLIEAYRIFQEYEIRHLPVVRANRLVGIISDRDIGERLLRKIETDRIGELGTVGQAMTTRVRTIAPDASVIDAAFLMHNEKFSSLPVVGEKGELLGILTVTDLLEILIAKLKGSAQTS